jgi:hypothetical protein
MNRVSAARFFRLLPKHSTHKRPQSQSVKIALLEQRGEADAYESAICPSRGARWVRYAWTIRQIEQFSTARHPLAACRAAVAGFTRGIVGC